MSFSEFFQRVGQLVRAILLVELLLPLTQHPRQQHVGPRRLGFGDPLSLVCAAITVAAPGLFYAGFMLSEPVAYPLVLAAVYAVAS